eukprot:XP_028343998.1 metalloprotease TIKI2-like [Physeter catodon]
MFQVGFFGQWLGGGSLVGQAQGQQKEPSTCQLDLSLNSSSSSSTLMFEDVFKFQAYTQQTLRASSWPASTGPSHLFTHPVSGLLPQSPVLEGSGASARVPEHSPDASLPSAQVLFALNQTLLQHESVRAGSLQAPYTTEDLIKHYNCGDLNAVIFNHDTSQLPNFINTTLPPHEQVTAQEIDSYFRQELIYKRNERMGKRVMTLLQENEDKICFFAFGAVPMDQGSDHCQNQDNFCGSFMPQEAMLRAQN